MSDIPFHATRMGQRFYEATVPELVRELARLNGNLERLLAVVEDRPESEPQPAEHAEDKAR